MSTKAQRAEMRARLAAEAVFGNSPFMGIRDIAAFTEDCEAMRLGPNSGSYLARNVTDNVYEGRFLPLVTAMTMADVA